MPNVSVFDVNGKKVSDIDLADGIFGIEPNTSAMHLVVVNYLANQRQGTLRSQRRRQKALETEGHRPCKTGLNQSSPVVPRRYCSRSQAP